ncbi:MAG: glycosyltransferase family 2 protein [Gammaproteobacteria bacterium]|jgi:glycosyltransferase involved in cell wall biosynthesis|uniref:Glycosyltransferase n=1 Tax=SAR86 cluster bacterium TaxID=2030880 RepID=A0A520MZH4_9GAMM|nr:hypothetical protein [Gammaproteobacteria bacterium]RPG34673.1 MAG: glycosyltransferase [Gammaproteobacteria bacterium TMED193]RZO26621.1 MAG: glycosyltransferase [SAR86 cluster bacterium]|tara:strand:+ start:4226 stop:5152 length:927 start_codon:yes stop_codon:yes gene_type:complete
MDSKPKITVIMSVFNGSKFLAESIQSILDQTFKEFEFIIINDGSTDNSLDIIRSFESADSRIKVISKLNEGLAKSLNTAISISKGEYIARMDADDISYKNRLEKQYEFMQKNKSIDLCGCSMDIIDELGNVTSEKIQASNNHEILKKRFFQSPILHITFFGKKLFFLKNNGYREEFKYAQDYDLVMRGIDAGAKICNIKHKLVQYRDYKQKIEPEKFIQQFRMTELIVKLSREREQFGKEVSTLDSKILSIFKVNNFDIFITKIFLSTYFLKNSFQNRILKRIVNLFAFALNGDLRRLLIRDFRAYKL